VIVLYGKQYIIISAFCPNKDIILKENNVLIASFNVNSLRTRLPILLEWLNQKKPDIVCLQETKVQDEFFPCEICDEAGYNYAFAGQKSYNGVAILSKSRIDDFTAGFDDEPQDISRLIKAEINGITIVNTYIPQGFKADSEKFKYKLKWYGRLREYFEKHFKPDDPIVWTGDLNIAPEAIDVYDPEGLFGHVCFHPEVQQKLKEVMEWGFTDVFRLHNKEAGQYTFWDFRKFNVMQRNMGWRLDHIMATRPMVEKCTGCLIDREPRMQPHPSDHTPVIAEFAL